MGYSAEVALIKLASSMGFLTTPYVFDPEQATAMAEAGADIVVAHMGLTTGGTIGLTEGAKTLDECVEMCQDIVLAVWRVQGDKALVIVHGGPVEGAEEAQYVLERCPGLCGFYGASSVERIPVERAIRGTVEGLKAVGIRAFET
jgi:predicted TIM-barrel enzyme